MQAIDHNPATRTLPKGFVPTPYAYHQELELDIDALSNLGVGIGRMEGWVVMVPFALPGERVRARVWKNHRNYSEADLLQVLRPSPTRVEPRCPLFGQCGGCQYQHLAYTAELEVKRSQVQEQLLRLGGVELTVAQVYPSPSPYGYRSKLTPHYARPRAGQPLAIGFQAAGRRSVVDVPQCPLATAAINAVLPAARQALQTRVPPPKRGGTLLLRDVDGAVVTDPKAWVETKVGPLRFRFCAGEFFQNNPAVLPAMLEHAVQAARGPGLDTLLDLYCGVGSFALWAAPHFRQIRGIEVSAAAIDCARHNAALNGIAHVDFIAGDAAHIFANAPAPAAQTAVILDPPRRGCSPDFIAQLLAFQPARIVYVSCDPATFARDMRLLHEGGYRLQAVQPFDLFPQTRHVEVVGTLGR
ncbi:MAG: class I SAM-dependent RNA methyltransferase [Polyangiales bacterium]